MILRPDGNDWLLIRQPDHALLAGELAAQWGNERFAPPEPREPALRAIAWHDNGWEEWEAQPRVDPATGTPYAFLKMPVESFLAIWRRGVRRAMAEEPYVGLLVGTHARRLVEGRLARGEDPPAARQELAELVAEVRAEQERTRRERSWDEAAESRFAANDALLKLCDALSLLFCCGPLTEQRFPDAPGPSPATRSALRVAPVDGHTLGFDPYPFRAASFAVSVRARRVPQRRYDDASLGEMLAAAPWETLTFGVSSAG
jgi:Protein of unknown function (DUF3891)